MADTLARGEGQGIGPAPEAASCDPLWDDWEVPPRVPAAPTLHLEGFDGPMDLLLDLAERQRIDLGRVSIADLAEQDCAAVAELRNEVSELVARVGGRDRSRTGRNRVAGEQCGELLLVQAAPVESKLGGERPVEFDEPRRVHRHGILPREEMLG